MVVRQKGPDSTIFNGGAQIKSLLSLWYALSAIGRINLGRNVNFSNPDWIVVRKHRYAGNEHQTQNFSPFSEYRVHL
jgi:hypothetical protein